MNGKELNIHTDQFEYWIYESIALSNKISKSRIKHTYVRKLTAFLNNVPALISCIIQMEIYVDFFVQGRFSGLNSQFGAPFDFPLIRVRSRSREYHDSLL